MFSGSGVLLLHFQINDAVFMLVVLIHVYIINLHHKHVVLFIFFIFLLKKQNIKIP